METNNTQIATGASSEAAGVQQTDKSWEPAMPPPVDIFEDAAGITLVADVPGVSKEGLDVRVHDHRLYIEASSALSGAAQLKLHHAEIRNPRYARSFMLSADFDPSKIDASLKDGVLKVAIPRREEAKPRRIEVQVG